LDCVYEFYQVKIIIIINPLKLLHSVGGMHPNPNMLYPCGFFIYIGSILPAACGHLHRLLGIVLIVVFSGLVRCQARGVVVVLVFLLYVYLY